MTARFRVNLCPSDSNGQLKEEKLFQLISANGKQYRLEPKYDGSRYLLHLSSGGNHLTSRRKSVKTGRYMDRIDQVPHIRSITVPKKYDGTVIDGEIVSASMKLAGKGGVAGILNSHPARARKLQRRYGRLVLKAFNILYLGDKSLEQKSFKRRRRLLRKFVQDLNSPYIQLTPQKKAVSIKQLKKIYRKSLEEGYEGLMIKDLEAIEGKGMWKWKAFRDTCAIITGFTEGKGKYVNLIGAVLFSVYKNKKLVEIGQCSGMTDAVRMLMSENKKKLIGKVIEVKAQEMGAAGRLRHPNFLRFRADYPPEKCTLEKTKKDLA